MKISTKGRYALHVMTELALYDGDEYIRLKEIAEKQGISEKYLEAIIKNLVKAEYVIGVRGKGGGYKLSRKPSEYTILDILEATEGSLAPVACLETHEAKCPHAGQCGTLPLWQGLDNLIQEYFSNITLEELARQVQERGGAAKDIPFDI